MWKKMNTSSDAAEQVVRLSLQGMEVAARISGSGAKNVAAILVAIAKDQQKIKGKTKLSNMLKSGKELKVFSIRESDLKKFTDEAKRYGVLFSAIVDKRNMNFDGMVDIMVKAEDAGKINRIVDRFNLATIDLATVKNEVSQITSKKESKGKIVKEQNTVDKIAEEILADDNNLSNPNVAKMEKSPLSEHSLGNKKSLDQGSNLKKTSVREELKNIKKTLLDKSRDKSNSRKLNNSRLKKKQLKEK